MQSSNTAFLVAAQSLFASRRETCDGKARSVKVPSD